MREFIDLLKKNFRSLNDISRSTSDLVDALIEDKELLQDVNEWLKSSAFNSEIYIEKNSDTKIMYVIERETGVKINIVDAGSGIRNLIPIITVVILSEKNQKYNDLKKFSSMMTWSNNSLRRAGSKFTSQIADRFNKFYNKIF